MKNNVKTFSTILNQNMNEVNIFVVIKFPVTLMWLFIEQNKGAFNPKQTFYVVNYFTKLKLQ